MTVNGGTRSSLLVDGSSTLILGNGTQTSTIDGDLTIGIPGDNSTLEILGTHTIQGTGGIIRLRKYSLINPAAGGGELTIKSTGACASRACSVVIHGEGEINVELDNRAYVVADTLIRLASADKTGNSAGYWIAENNGTFAVACEVNGACHWQIVDLIDTASQFVIIEALGCVAATGPVTLESGSLVLELDTQFCTTGALTWRSVCIDGGCSGTTSPSIATTGTSSAVFGLGGAATCSACP